MRAEDAPEGADLWEFLKTDGKRTEKPKAQTVVTLGHLFQQFEQGMPPGAMEANSLLTIRIHKNHLLRVLGTRTPVQSVMTTTVQGYINAHTEYDGRAGLEAARQFRADVCVLDIHMPGLDGCHLARALRAEFGGRVRLIAVTGVTGGDYDERIDHAGFDARFAKPADLPSLLKALSAAGTPT